MGSIIDRFYATFTPDTLNFKPGERKQFYVKTNVNGCYSDSTIVTVDVAPKIEPSQVDLGDFFGPMCFINSSVFTTYTIQKSAYNSYKWYVDNVLKQNTNDTSFVFKPLHYGNYNISILPSYVIYDSVSNEPKECAIGPTFKFEQQFKYTPQNTKLVGRDTIYSDYPSAYYYVIPDNSENSCRWMINDSIISAFSQNNFSKWITWDEPGEKTLYVYEYNGACWKIDSLVITKSTNTSSPIINNNSFTISPNPANNYVNVLFDENGITSKIELYNSLGILLQTKESNENKVIFNVFGYTSGTYKIVVKNKNGISQQSFVKY